MADDKEKNQDAVGARMELIADSVALFLEKCPEADPAILYSGVLLAMERHARERNALPLMAGAVCAAHHALRRAGIPSAGIPSAGPFIASTQDLIASVSSGDSEQEKLRKLVGAFVVLFTVIASGHGSSMGLNALINCYYEQVIAHGCQGEAIVAMETLAGMLCESAKPGRNDISAMPVGGRA